MQKEYANIYENLYKNHWWWRARESILISEIKKLNLGKESKILDYGCGNGLFFSALEEFGQPVGIETDLSLLSEKSQSRVKVFNDTIDSECYNEMSFDLILALDVLEHIEDDKGIFKILFSKLNSNGYMIITVPAMMELWDQHDDINKHFRRYSMKSFLDLLGVCDAEILKIRYFFHSLYFPKKVISSFNKNKKKKIDQSEIPHYLLNSIAKVYCEFEYKIFEKLKLLFGSSLIAILKK